MKRRSIAAVLATAVFLTCLALSACIQQTSNLEEPVDPTTFADVDDQGVEGEEADGQDEAKPVAESQDSESQAAAEEEPKETEDAEVKDENEDAEAGEPEAGVHADAQALRASLNITEDYRDSFIHGPKGPEYQRYIVLHDTEGDADGLSVVSYWDGNGTGVAAHFVVNTDGTIVQCVDMDNITHHAGFGDAGHNDLYGVPEDGRDDRVGTQPIGEWAPDYGMNSYSIGIEMVHVGGSGYYPEEQLEAVDNLIAYIDAYYGFESTIIDHKAWRRGNSDTSPEFADYLANYQDHRTHL